MSLVNLSTLRRIQYALIESVVFLSEEDAGYFVTIEDDYLLKKTETRYEIRKDGRLICWVDRRKLDWFSKLMYKWLRINGY